MCQATEIWECGQSVQVAVSNTEATRTVSVRGVLGTLGVGGNIRGQTGARSCGHGKGFE